MANNQKSSNDMTMKEIIQHLLDSDLSAYKIGKEAGVQDSLVKKLRNGDQEIGATKYENLEKMADFAKRSGILLHDAYDPNDPNYIDVKLPKSVIAFIEDIKMCIGYINGTNKASIENVYVYDEYRLNEQGNSEYKKSYIEVNENILIPLNSKSMFNDDWIPYNINIKNRIESSSQINNIKDLRLIFNAEQLIHDLKMEDKKGNKVKMNGAAVWHNNKTRTIEVFDFRENTKTLGYEANYFDIRYSNGRGGTND